MGKTAKKVKEKRGRALQKELVANKEAKQTEETINKMKDEDLFEITEKSKGIKKKRYPLEPGRFKKKMWKFLGRSISEEKQVKELAKKLKNKPQEQKKSEKEIFDLWETDAVPTARPIKNRTVYPLAQIFPAVIPPHAGQSYNPSDTDYKVFYLLKQLQDLLKTAIDYEKEQQLKDKKALESIQRPITEPIDVVEPVPEPEKEPEQKPEEDIMKISVNKPVDATKKKTTVKRNREKRNRILMQLEKQKNVEAEKNQSVNKLRQIIKEVKAESEAHKEKLRKKEEAKKKKLAEQREGIVFGAKKIGRYKFEQLAVDFQLPEDLPKNLNELKVEEGSAIRNCYESILKRGLVQPSLTKRHQKKIKQRLRLKFSEKQDDQIF